MRDPNVCHLFFSTSSHNTSYRGALLFKRVTPHISPSHTSIYTNMMILHNIITFHYVIFIDVLSSFDDELKVAYILSSIIQMQKSNGSPKKKPHIKCVRETDADMGLGVCIS